MANDPSERRAGDWTHRQLRTKESANAIVKDPNAKKWYEDTFWIVFFLVILWPLGLVLMWRSSWPVPVKAIVSVALAGIVYVVFNMSLAVQQMGS